MVLHALPGISDPAKLPSSHISSVSILRDTLAQTAVSRSIEVDTGAASQSEWPAYVRARALQTVAAVGKKALALDLEQRPTEASQIAQQHMHIVSQMLVSLLGAEEHTLSLSGLALLRAIIDEYALVAVQLEPADKGKGKAKAVEQGTAIGLTSTAHMACKAAFQQFGVQHRAGDTRRITRMDVCAPGCSFAFCCF